MHRKESGLHGRTACQASELNRVPGLGFMGEACPMSALNNGSKVIMGEALNMGADIGTIREK